MTTLALKPSDFFLGDFHIGDEPPASSAEIPKQRWSKPSAPGTKQPCKTAGSSAALHR